MSGYLVMLFIVVALALGIAAAVYSARQERKRLALYGAFAAARGLEYQPEGDDSVHEQFGDDRPFGIGHSHRANDVLSGTLDRVPVLGFTYIYKVTRSNGKSTSTTTYRWQICAVWLPSALPWMTIQDEGIFGGAVAGALGFRDVQLESDDFNRRFRYKAADERYASALMPPRMMELMLQGQTGVTRIHGRILYNAVEQRPLPDDIAASWDFLVRCAALIPSWVLKDYGR
jgi:hypothetical protein